jgi:hypothetical protein
MAQVSKCVIFESNRIYMVEASPYARFFTVLFGNGTIQTGTAYKYRKLLVNYAFGILDEKEQRILELHDGLGGGKTRNLDEIGREFDLSGARIGQIRNKALRKMGSRIITVSSSWLPKKVMETGFENLLLSEMLSEEWKDALQNSYVGRLLDRYEIAQDLDLGTLFFSSVEKQRLTPISKVGFSWALQKLLLMKGYLAYEDVASDMPGLVKELLDFQLEDMAHELLCKEEKNRRRRGFVLFLNSEQDIRSVDSFFQEHPCNSMQGFFEAVDALDPYENKCVQKIAKRIREDWERQREEQMAKTQDMDEAERAQKAIDYWVDSIAAEEKEPYQAYIKFLKSRAEEKPLEKERELLREETFDLDFTQLSKKREGMNQNQARLVLEEKTVELHQTSKINLEAAKEDILEKARYLNKLLDTNIRDVGIKQHRRVAMDWGIKSTRELMKIPDEEIKYFRVYVSFDHWGPDVDANWDTLLDFRKEVRQNEKDLRVLEEKLNEEARLQSGKMELDEKSRWRVDKQLNKLLDTNVRKAGFGAMTVMCLECAGIKDVRDIADGSFIDVMTVRGLDHRNMEKMLDIRTEVALLRARLSET